MENEVQEDVEDANNVEAKKQTLFNSASPMKVIKVCKLLDRKQRKKIMKVGFGSFLDIKCSKLFPELCKYLMDHFDPDTSALEFPEDERGIIPIIVDTVFEVLGIPKGALPVIYQYDSVSVKYVLDLLQVEDGRQPKISDIETRLTEMGTAEDPFLLLWMLYVVCFLAPTTGVRVSPNCYPSLVNVSQINKLDWCRFTINILIQTAKAKNKNCFKACMPLLMLKYVDSLVTKGIHVEAEGPRICVWTNQMVKAAIAQDTNRDGTFGILPGVKCPFVQNLKLYISMCNDCTKGLPGVQNL
ncbi:uncharacterized protein LOC104584864 isoform X2 [Brachypodium distachyon]|uniref:uncharacterized protein LOC104584864 isoform X2 n=1 Tax=Brachypodium distachyon TaxID=15368 RepID=UPI000D0CC6B4|nr:uncharacterized protein LOC104584864 isoform X2 [Brachypodium distachyon]|eukprot:XP_024310845.1 uncharacterized protein LOC104584864 isoform X2 [Brachypodium distachyon]